MLDVLLVVATIVGPYLAVRVSAETERRREQDQAHRAEKQAERGRQLHVFRTLLATQRQGVTPDHVAALNLCRIDFYQCPKIIEAWSKYFDNLDQKYADLSEAERQLLPRTRQDLLNLLLKEIADELGLGMSAYDLRRSYLPEALVARDKLDKDVKSAALDLFSGRVPLRVAASDPQSTSASQSSRSEPPISPPRT